MAVGSDLKWIRLAGPLLLLTSVLGVMGGPPASAAPAVTGPTTAAPTRPPAPPIPGAKSVTPGGASAAPAGSAVHHGRNGETDVTACGVPKSGRAQCLVRIRSGIRARPSPLRVRAAISSAVLGDNGAYDPSYLQSAYNAPSASAGAGKTVAIVDAYDDPNAESDLASYRSLYGLSPCTTANGCFSKVNQTGGTVYPTADGGWAVEISLDLDMVSALCPNCHILLVEANSNYMSDLGQAEDEAVSLGATVVSNSYGTVDGGDNSAYDQYYDHQGVTIAAASGDGGNEIYPASLPNVTAVGGTSLDQLTNTGTRDATESAWSYAGTGCSTEPKPSWQHDIGCKNRTVADVSAVADPATPVWIYDSYPNSGTAAGWNTVGGTSVATPIIASFYALAGGPTGSAYSPAGYPYAQPGSLNDVTTGQSGSCPSYLCQAGPGYDGPTGLGTPNGVRAFQPSLPGAPSDLEIGGQSGSATLTWSPPLVNGGSSITGYNVYRSDHGSSPIAQLGASTRGFTDSGLSNGSSYSYTVTAVSVVGEGPAATATVVPQPLVSMTITPGTTTLTAGTSQTFDVLGYDGNGDALGDESGSASFSIAPDGSCVATTCTATVAGPHTIRASVGSLSITASMTVEPGLVYGYQVEPSQSYPAVGQPQSFTGATTDQYGNAVTDVTGSSAFSIAPDGTCSGSTCTTSGPGGHTVTGTYNLLNNVTSVSTGDPAPCAVSATGQVYCWGDNQYGALGIGALNVSTQPRVGCVPSSCADVPLPVPGLGDIRQVSTGLDYACALTSAGAVYCWGSNTYGQLGNGTTTDAYSPVPAVGLSSGVTSIAAGLFHTCAVLSTGRVDCWGFNQWGQLGNGTGNNSSVPVPADLSVAATSVSVGGNSTCAVTIGGSVECWGNNAYGQFGNGTTNNRAIPQQVSGLTSGVTAVSVGDYSVCAIVEGGDFCWGSNAYGQLGNGTTNDSLFAGPVTGLSSGVTAISTSAFDSCAVTSVGAVFCWGDNGAGELGNGTATSSTSPVPVVGLTGAARSVSTSDVDTCALVGTSGLECWGFNGGGELGNGTVANEPGVDDLYGSPFPMTTGQLTSTATVTALAPSYITISPGTAAITAGGSQTYQVEAVGATGVVQGIVTQLTRFSIAPDGTCTGNVCTAVLAGPHVVTAQFDGMMASSNLSVDPGLSVGIGVSPASSTMVAGASQAFSMGRVDVYGNIELQFTPASFTISPDGSCQLNVCTADIAGPHVVHASYFGTVASASVNVVAGQPTALALTPANSTISVTGSQTYRAEVVDAFGNPVQDVTTAATFSIAPDGNCSGNTCTVASLGLHTVTATSGAYSTSTTLTGGSGPSIRLSKSTGLVGNEAVKVSGSLWRTNGDIGISVYECAAAVYEANRCTATASTATVSSTGAFQDNFNVAIGSIDSVGDQCGLSTAAHCYLVVVGGGGDAASAPLTYSLSSVVLTKKSGVVGNYLDKVTAKAYPAGDTVTAMECDANVVPASNLATNCEPGTTTTGLASSTGVVTFNPLGVRIHVGSDFTDGANGTCAPGSSCTVVVVDESNPAIPVVEIPVTFAVPSVTLSPASVPNGPGQILKVTAKNFPIGETVTATECDTAFVPGAAATNCDAATQISGVANATGVVTALSWTPTVLTVRSTATTPAYADASPGGATCAPGDTVGAGKPCYVSVVAAANPAFSSSRPFSLTTQLAPAVRLSVHR